MGIKTVTVTTGIEDTRIRAASADLNYGASVSLGHEDNVPVLFRLATAQIPKAFIKAVRFSILTDNVLSTTAFRVAPTANWVVGTADGAAQEGSCCWNGIAYSAGGTTPWLGGSNFSSADYIVAISGTFATQNARIISSLPVEWFVGWRDNLYTNNGFVLIRASGAAAVNIATSEQGVNLGPRFEFDIYDGACNEPVPSSASNSNLVCDDENELAIAALRRLRPYGWLLTGLEVIKPFGLKEEFRELFDHYHDVDGCTNQDSCKRALRFLQLEYDLPILESIALMKRISEGK